MSRFGIDAALPTSSPDDWRYLWDSRRDCTETNVRNHLQGSKSALPDALVLVSATTWGREPFIHAAGALLRKHYVEEDDLRFCLSNDYLRWAIDTPSCDSDLLIGLAVKESEPDKEKCLVGLALAVPMSLHHSNIEGNQPIQSDMLDMVCVARPFRGRRLCPFLYAEVQRRCHQKWIPHILATSGDNLKFPICAARYHHMPNPEQLPKLIEARFAPPPPCNQTVELMQDIMRTRCQLLLTNQAAALPLREMTKEDVSQLRQAYNASVIQSSKVGMLFATDEEFAHALFPRSGIVESLVVDDTTDFISFYTNETEILAGTLKGEFIRQAYVYYSCCQPTNRADLLVAASRFILQKHDNPEGKSIDTVNCLCGINGNSPAMLRAAGFRPGSGILKYYQFNGPPGSLRPEDVVWYTA